jgi:hypothetical protein
MLWYDQSLSLIASDETYLIVNGRIQMTVRHELLHRVPGQTISHRSRNFTVHPHDILCRCAVNCTSDLCDVDTILLFVTLDNLQDFAVKRGHTCPSVRRVGLLVTCGVVGVGCASSTRRTRLKVISGESRHGKKRTVLGNLRLKLTWSDLRRW